MLECPDSSLCKKNAVTGKYEPLAGTVNNYKLYKDKSFEVSFAGSGTCKGNSAVLNVSTATFSTFIQENTAL